jgi:hypothetical protein
MQIHNWAKVLWDLSKLSANTASRRRHYLPLRKYQFPPLGIISKDQTEDFEPEKKQPRKKSLAKGHSVSYNS